MGLWPFTAMETLAQLTPWRGWGCSSESKEYHVWLGDGLDWNVCISFDGSRFRIWRRYGPGSICHVVMDNEVFGGLEECARLAVIAYEELTNGSR